MTLPPLLPVVPRGFYDRSADQVARELLGKTLISTVDNMLTGGIIVETEAYLSRDDPACHASRGLRPRNRTMFGPPGHFYVYTIHAKVCLNAVTERAGEGSAVLIRAVEPLWGDHVMMARRGTLDPRSWTRGPARLCQALGVQLCHDGHDATRADQLWIGESLLTPPLTITASGRIGISQAQDLPLRFFLDGNPFVSGLARLHQCRPGPAGVLLRHNFQS